MHASQKTDISRQQVLKLCIASRLNETETQVHKELDNLLFIQKHTQDTTLQYLLYLHTNNIQVTNKCNSVLAWCLGITNEKPIKEADFKPGSMPDADLDCQDDKRDQVITWLQEEYGFDNISHIGTYGTLKAKAAIKEAARVLNYPYAIGEKLAKLILDPIAGKTQSLETCYDKVSELAKYRAAEDSDEGKTLVLAEKLEDRIKSFGTHAGGIVISDTPVGEWIPLTRGKDKKPTTQFEMNNVEEAGLIKFDILGLKTLSTIIKCVELVKQNKNVDISINNIPLDDKDVYKLLSTGNTKGIFQFEGSGISDLLAQLKPTCLEDLALANALYRPGPISSGMLDQVIQVRNGSIEPQYMIPELKSILEPTAGVVCLPKGTLIDMPNGNSTIEQIEKNDVIYTSDTHSIWNGKVANIQKSYKKTISFELSDGKTISSSQDHTWPTVDGDIKASDLLPRCTIRTSGLTNKIGSALFSRWPQSKESINLENESYLLGLLIGDGELKLGTKCIACHTETQAKWIANYMSETFGGEAKWRFSTRAWYAYSAFNSSPHRSALTKFLDTTYGYNKWISKSQTKHLPPNVIDFTYASRVNLITGLWDADGHYGHKLIYYRSTSPQLLRDIQEVLASLKVAAIVRSNYVYIIDRHAFCNLITPRLPNKIYQCDKTYGYYPAISVKTLKKHIEQKQLQFSNKHHKKQLMRRLRGNGLYQPKGANSFAWSIEGFSEVYIEVYKLTYLQDTRPVYIESIKSNTHQECYDLTMQDQIHPYFVADGVITHNCFQESIMHICSQLAGYSMAEADNMRKIVGKKKEKLMAKEKDKFVSGLVDNNISKSKAEQLFAQIEGFAQYGFNKSHAISYSYISYQMAYLKTHYPSEFMCACLITDSNEDEKITQYIAHCKEQGIEILPPTINKSMFGFSTTGDTITFGFEAIKNVGKPARVIIKERDKNGAFTGLTNFCDRMDLSKFNKKKLTSLIHAGVFDEFKQTRQGLLATLDGIWDHKDEIKKYNSKLETYLAKIEKFNARQEELEWWASLDKSEAKAARVEGKKKPGKMKEPTPPEKPDSVIDTIIPEMPELEKLNLERDMLGCYISGHPLDFYPKTSVNIEQLKEGQVKTCTLMAVPTIKKEITTKRKQKMAYITLEDKSGTIEGVILPHIFPRLGSQIEVGKPGRFNLEIEVIQTDESTIVKSKIINFSEIEIGQPQEASTVLLNQLEDLIMSEITNTKLEIDCPDHIWKTK